MKRIIKQLIKTLHDSGADTKDLRKRFNILNKSTSLKGGFRSRILTVWYYNNSTKTYSRITKKQSEKYVKETQTTTPVDTWVQLSNKHDALRR